MSSKNNPHGLTNKQLRFCEEYMIDLNATQAAIRAGYSENSAGQIGEQNLKKLEIQTYLAELKKVISERNQVTIDECVQTLAKMMRHDISKLYDDNNNLLPVHEMPKEARLVLEGFDSEEHRVDGLLLSTTKKVKISNRYTAIEKLMRHLGGYEADNSQVQPQVTILNTTPLSDDPKGNDGTP